MRSGMIGAMLLLVGLAGPMQAYTLTVGGGPSDYYDVTLRKNASGVVVVAIGDLGSRPLPQTIITALVFMAAWARTAHPTAPVTVERAGTVLPVPLLLPAVGFAVVQETALSAVVRVGHLTVQAGDLYTGIALLTLERVSADAPWTVTSVVVQ